jgi:uncharacterized YigZ family protein
MESDSFLTISAPSQGLFKDRKSRFVSLAFPVTKEDEIKEIVKRIRKEYYDAAHHCYAYVLGAKRAIFRSNDDGEPAAGAPILGQINSRNLTNILVVVVRYFGGVKLGVPGLINAFRTATSDALDNANVVTGFEKNRIWIHFLYPLMNTVMGILKEEGIEIKEQKFDEQCEITVDIRTSKFDKILMILEKTEGVKINNKD